MQYLEAVQKERALIDSVGISNAHMVWTLGLYLEEPDLSTLASQSLTDGGNDKKIDFIRLDLDLKRIVIAQGYFSSKISDKAPANKASDLNTAAAWLTCGDVMLVPDDLRKAFVDCRSAIDSNEIEYVDLVYVHNLPESGSVADELKTAAAYLASALGRTDISVTYRELGLETTQRLFVVQEAAIRVRESVVCPAVPSFIEKGPGWEAYVQSVPGQWLRSIFARYGEDLFSANYRGFLGLGKRKKINTGIKETAESKSDHFWVYNNGVTILTTGLRMVDDGVELSGISVINGAQTTGSLGHTDPSRHSLEQVRVLCRIVKCDNPEVISDIIKYNNTQNEITNWDQYSNNSEQQRIAGQFRDLGWSYSLKRGFAAAGAELGIEKVVQPVLAVGGNFVAANRGKNQIFERINLYKHAFENRSAKSILFAYSLSRAVDDARLELKKKSECNQLTPSEAKQLRLFQGLRFKFYFVALVGNCLPSLTGMNIDPNRASFTIEVSRLPMEHIVGHWRKVIKAMLALLAASSELAKEDFDFNSEASFESVATQLSSQIEVTRLSASALFDEFSSVVWPNY